MNLTQSAVPPQFGNLRKREFLEYVEASLNDGNRRGKFNAAYREDDRKFMRFLIQGLQKNLLIHMVRDIM